MEKSDYNERDKGGTLDDVKQGFRKGDGFKVIIHFCGS